MRTGRKTIKTNDCQINFAGEFFLLSNIHK
nr:MAG TPA: hypothetical protein [Caudoviricetes sp.]